MAKGPIQVRTERLLDERATVSHLHDDLLGVIENRDADERTPSDVEGSQLASYRERAAQIDTELGELSEHLKREQDAQAASKRIRTHLAGGIDGVDVRGDDEIAYRTFAGYARDWILAKATGPIAEQIRGRAGGDDARHAARERLTKMRTPANTLSGDVAGLIPDQHIAQIYQVIDDSRPIVASATRAALERGRLSFPKVTQRPVVAVQTTQKTEAGNQAMNVTMVESTGSTYLGGGDLSWQAIEWSTPNALDLWFRLAASDYALKTESDAAQVVEEAGFLNGITTKLGATPTFAQFMTAVAAGAGEVYTNSGRMADTLYMAPDRFYFLAGLTTDVSSPFVGNGSLSLVGQSGNGGPLNIVVSRGMDAGAMVVGDSDALIVAETAGAPVQLRAVEPAIGGLEVGIIGAFEAVVVEDEAFAIITTAS